MSHHIYTLWASLRGEESPWMLVAEDEFAWEGNPDRCEKAFQDARNRCDENDWDYREVTLVVDYASIEAHFKPGQVDAAVLPLGQTEAS